MDYEGILKIESNLVLRATVLEGIEPQKASYIYLMISRAFIGTGLSSMKVREKAIHYLERSFVLSEKEILHECMRLLVTIYIQEGRHDEALATVKRLTIRIPQHELIDPDLILDFVHIFSQASLYDGGVIDILTMFLGTINRFWDKEKRALAYLAFGEGYTCSAEYEKAVSFYHKAFAITDDPERKVTVLCQMGYMYKCSCNYDAALATLNQAMEIISAESGEERNKSKRWSEHTALVHTNIGDVLSEQGKRDFEALENYECALDIMKERDPGDVDCLSGICYQGLGLVHARLENWDEAIKALKLAHSWIGIDANADSRLRSGVCDRIGRVLLDQYCSDERLRHETQEREKILNEVASFTFESMQMGPPNEAFLHYAQQKYFVGATEDATKLLMVYFEAEMEKKMEICCRSCKRKAGNGTEIKICRSCRVVDYCSEAHQTLAWRRGRLSHKVMCPFLKRYRLVAKSKNRIDTTKPFEDICKDFFETVCVLKYEVV